VGWQASAPVLPLRSLLPQASVQGNIDASLTENNGGVSGPLSTVELFLLFFVPLSAAHNLPVSIKRTLTQQAQMDWVGQRTAERLMMQIILAAAAVSFVVGYALKDFKLMVQINAAGLLLTSALVLPEWPWYKRNPVKWLPPLKPSA
jgi:signal peptidase complex subunit 1